MTDRQNTRHINITSSDNHLNLQHLPFTRGSAGSSRNLNSASNRANNLDWRSEF